MILDYFNIIPDLLCCVRYHPIQVRRDYVLVYTRRGDGSGWDISYAEKNRNRYVKDD